MKNYLIGICIAAQLLVRIVFGQDPQVTRSTARSDLLERRVVGDNVEYLATPKAFFKAVTSVGGAGGVVRLPTCEPDPIKQVWRPSNSRLADLLDLIVLADTDYRWRFEKGAVNLLPKTGEPELLKTHIARFDVEDVGSTRLALDYLLEAPEIKNRMAELNLSNDALEVSSILSSPKPSTFGLHCRNVTLREALNAIAVAKKGAALWVYSERHCNGQHQVAITF